VKALRDAGASIDRVVTVVDRDAGAGALLKESGVVLDALVKATDLIRGPAKKGAEGRD